MKQIKVSVEIEKIVIQPGKDDVQVTLSVPNNLENVAKLSGIDSTVLITGNALPEQQALPEPDELARVARRPTRVGSYVSGQPSRGVGLGWRGKERCKVSTKDKPDTAYPMIESLRQMCRGPVWDGNLISKSHRDELCRCGYAEKAYGWNILTADGLLVCINLGILTS